MVKWPLTADLILTGAGITLLGWISHSFSAVLGGVLAGVMFSLFLWYESTKQEKVKNVRH